MVSDPCTLLLLKLFDGGGDIGENRSFEGGNPTKKF